MSNLPTSPAYIGIEECRKAVFGTGPEAPSKRSWDSWRAKGYYPFIRVGKRIFANPDEVSRALARRFKVNAIDTK
jgi:hypothetical protein